VSRVVYELLGYSIADTSLGTLDIRLYLDGETKSSILISDLTVTAHTDDYAQFRAEKAIREEAKEAQDNVDLDDSDDEDSKGNPLDMVPTLIQGWLIRILKKLVVVVVNLKCGLSGGDLDSPWAGQVLFEIPAVTASIVSEVAEGDLLSTVMNMSLRFVIDRLRRETADSFHSYERMWQECDYGLKCTLGPPSEPIAIGTLPRAEMTLVAEAAWSRIRIVAGVKKVQIFGFMERVAGIPEHSTMRDPSPGTHRMAVQLLGILNEEEVQIMWRDHFVDKAWPL